MATLTSTFKAATSWYGEHWKAGDFASGIGWESDIAFAREDEARLAAFDKLPKHFPEFRRRIAEVERADG